MEVFALLGYESELGTFLLGIYHTEEDAEFHKNDYIRETEEEDSVSVVYDSYEIVRRVIGARPLA